MSSGHNRIRGRMGILESKIRMIAIIPLLFNCKYSIDIAKSRLNVYCRILNAM
jgi:hypothetical protein